MAISRAQLAKELEPGLNALFGLEYNRYENEHAEIFEEESSDRAFEEEVMLAGFSTAPVKNEGNAISFDDAQETFTARYTHETIALAFSITEEAIEDNLYDRLASRYTKALARSMAQTKQIKASRKCDRVGRMGPGPQTQTKKKDHGLPGVCLKSVLALGLWLCPCLRAHGPNLTKRTLDFIRLTKF